MPKPRPPHLHRQETRHGAVVWYVRRGHGRRIRICAQYGSEAFWAEYRAAMEGKQPSSKQAKAHTLAWGLERYRNSSTWAGLSNATRRQRENIYRAVVKTAGDVILRAISSATIRAGRERRAVTPHAANNFLKAMRAFFAWAVDKGLVTVDPTKGVKWLKGTNDEGFPTWSEEELDRFEAKWPLGTRERLAFDLLLYTGLRRGDAVRVGRQHVRDGMITLRAEKTGEEVFIDILPPLAASIAATKTGDLAFLVSETGKPWVKESSETGSGTFVARPVVLALRTDCAKPARRARRNAAQPSANSWQFSDGRAAGWLSTTRARPTVSGSRGMLFTCSCGHKGGTKIPSPCTQVRERTEIT
jgi:integrase